MDNLLFSLNATLPIFFLMMIGYIFKRIGWIKPEFASGMNTFVFKIALPVNLFYQLYDVDVYSAWDTGYVIYCFAATLVSVIIAFFISLLLREKSIRGEFVQGAYRSSASLLGMAYIENIYGESSMGPLMMLGAVPLYNVMAVIVLSVMNPENPGLDRKSLKKSIIGIAKNPIIWGIIIGFLWALLRIPLPKMCATTVNYIGRLASPMGLLALGASLEFRKIGRKIKPVLLASFLKLIGFTALLIPFAVLFGYRQDKLLAVLIMTGSASTVAGFVMAKNMGHEGTVSSGTVMLTTVLSSFTLTFWIWLFKSLHML